MDSLTGKQFIFTILSLVAMIFIFMFSLEWNKNRVTKCFIENGYSQEIDAKTNLVIWVKKENKENKSCQKDLSTNTK